MHWNVSCLDERWEGLQLSAEDSLYVQCNTSKATTATTMMMVSKKVITVLLPVLNTAIFDGFSRRCTRSGFCSTNLPSFHDLCTEADRNLFHKVLSYLMFPTTCSLLFHPFRWFGVFFAIFVMFVVFCVLCSLDL